MSDGGRTSEPMAALESLLEARRSCRGYLPDQVDPATIERLLAAAQRTPSWCNTQPWHVVVTLGDQTHELQEVMASDERFGPDLPFTASYEGVYAERRR